MQDTGLDKFLFPQNSPYTQGTQNSGFMFDYQNESGIISSSKIRNAAIGNAQLGTAVIGTAQIGTLTFDQISGGTINVLAALGTGNIKLDGANKRIVINDGTVDRIYIGYQAGGF